MVSKMPMVPHSQHVRKKTMEIHRCTRLVCEQYVILNTIWFQYQVSADWVGQGHTGTTV